MNPVSAIFRRELASYFATPLAYVFIVLFLGLAGVATFYAGSFYDREQADLAVFFGFHPWLYLMLVPAVAMRSWAEERRSGSIELLLTLPVSVSQAVVAKFIAGWVFLMVALGLTFPMWLTVNYLGEPDNGAILASYIASALLAAALLAISSCLSALSSNQVVAFLAALGTGFAMLLAGFPLVLDVVSSVAPDRVVNAVADVSLLTHYNSMVRGVLDLADVVFFLLTIATFLFATTLVLDLKKAAE